MRNYLLFALVVATGCSHTQPSHVIIAKQIGEKRAQQRGLASVNGKVYLRTQEFANPAHDALLAAATGKKKLTAAQTAKLMEEYEASPQFLAIKEQYANGLYQKLGINPEKSQDWIAANDEFYKGIINYVGRSDESMADDEGPSWMSINDKFRTGVKFTATERTFVNEILASIRQLPMAEGLAFRGESLKAEWFDAIPTRGEWTKPSFTSTTLSPASARSFGSGQQGWSRSGVLILKLKTGYPVSPLTFDHGFMGQPGRFGEYELLIAPGKKFFVHHKIDDAANQIYYVFAEEK